MTTERKTRELKLPKAFIEMVGNQALQGHPAVHWSHGQDASYVSDRNILHRSCSPTRHYSVIGTMRADSTQAAALLS